MYPKEKKKTNLQKARRFGVRVGFRPFFLME